MLGRVGLGVLEVSFGGLSRMAFLWGKNLSLATVIFSFCFTQGCCGPGSAWICIILGSQIRIRIRVKRWIQISPSPHIQVKIWEPYRLKNTY
jgi:hypothetical protein